MPMPFERGIDCGAAYYQDRADLAKRFAFLIAQSQGLFQIQSIAWTICGYR